MPNRHERRKAMVVEQTMMPASELAALPCVCAWDGCDATYKPSATEYLPKGWTALLMFWSKEPPLNIWKDLSPGDMLRDASLCPEHTAALDGLLKPLAREINREAEGSA
jgi:hypothetical protein